MHREKLEAELAPVYSGSDVVMERKASSRETPYPSDYRGVAANTRTKTKVRVPDDAVPGAWGELHLPPRNPSSAVRSHFSLPQVGSFIDQGHTEGGRGGPKPSKPRRQQRTGMMRDRLGERRARSLGLTFGRRCSSATTQSANLTAEKYRGAALHERRLESDRKPAIKN